MHSPSEVSTTRQLAAMLQSPAAGDEEILHQQVTQIDVHEPLFSGRMTELYIAMGEDRIERRNIRSELNADRSKTTTPEDWRDVAEGIIRNLLRDYSLRLLDEYMTRTWNRSKGRYVIKKAEAFIKESHPELQPDFYSASLNAIRSYYQSLGIAAYVLAGDTLQESLRQESMLFAEWVGEDTHRLSLARRCKRINPKDLNELSAIMQQTPVSLDDGIL